MKGLYQGHPKSGVPVFDSGKETLGKFILFEHDCSKISFKLIIIKKRCFIPCHIVGLGFQHYLNEFLILYPGDLKIKCFALNDREKALKEEFVKR